MESLNGHEGVEERFARRVKFEREARGLSQADLAKLLNEKGLRTHPTTIAKIESRDVDRPRTIRLDEAAALSEVFGTTLDDLIGRPRKFDRQPAVDRVPTVAFRTLQTIGSAVGQLEQALDALNIEPNELRRWADLNENDLADDIVVDPPFLRAILMLSDRGRLGETLTALVDVVGQIGSYATMDEAHVEAKFHEQTALLSRHASSAADNADPS